MKVVGLADMHGFLPRLEEGDMLIVAGDCTANGRMAQWKEFFAWFKEQPFEKKILVGGNHDLFLKSCVSNVERDEFIKAFPEDKDLREDTWYEHLKNTGTEYKGLKIWGSPHTPWFPGVNSYCDTFMDKDPLLEDKWNLIPGNTNILVTHGPQFGTLDKNVDKMYVGSKSLNHRISKLKKLKLHVFGHIHEAYGQCHQAYYTKDAFDKNPVPVGYLSVNCSHCNEHYRPVNKPVYLDLS